MPYVYSGFCLAAMFGSIIWEHHRMKKEERELRERMRALAEMTRRAMGSELRFGSLDSLPEPAARA
ncbi:MAG: hypothetical protein LBQ79_14645 [Deltaproteobacteria bacterium]|jgi:hypothetical protein|nr:hypothetical protein [Deltaproteobacteria bacterium]